MEQKVTILSNSINNLCGSWMMFVDHRNLLDFQMEHQKDYHAWRASSCQSFSLGTFMGTFHLVRKEFCTCAGERKFVNFSLTIFGKY